MKFLLETAAAAWGTDNFNEYLNGSTFTLYRDTTTEKTLGTTQMKTLNRLQTTMNDHNFKIKDIQKSDLPNSLRKEQNIEKPEPTSQNKTFNKSVMLTQSTLIPSPVKQSSASWMIHEHSPPRPSFRTAGPIWQFRPSAITGASHTDFRKPSRLNRARCKPAD